MNLRKLSVGAGLLALSVAAMASPNVVGHWSGHVSIDFSKLPPQAQQQASQIKAMLAKTHLSLNLNADKTYTASTQGVKTAQGGDKKDSGKWSLSGHTLTLTSSKKDSHLPPLTVAQNGKTLQANVPGGFGTVTFTRS